MELSPGLSEVSLCCPCSHLLVKEHPNRSSCEGQIPGDAFAFGGGRSNTYRYKEPPVSPGELHSHQPNTELMPQHLVRVLNGAGGAS